MKPVLAFDMDGVLVDVTASFRRAIAATVASMGGGAVDDDEVQALKNGGGFNNDWDLSRELLRRRGRDYERARVIAEFDGHYLGGLRERETWLLAPEMIAALTALYRLAIFTGRPRRDCIHVLGRFGVAAVFDPVLTLEDVANAKPAPDGLCEIQHRCAPAPIAAYLGDTVDDARCAAAAGIPFLGIIAPGQARAAESAARLGAYTQRVFPDVTTACAALLALTPEA